MKRRFLSWLLLGVITLGATAMSGCNEPDPETVECTVTFNMNGSNEAGVSPQVVKRGEKATEPTAPSRTGYNFRGWFKEASCENEWDFDADVVTADVTLYAKWEQIAEPVYYTVMFDSNGGGNITAQYVLEGSKAAVPTQPGKEGFDFKGWFKDSDLTQAWDFDVDVVTADITLYAKWEETPLMDGEPVTIFVEAGEFMMGAVQGEPNTNSATLGRETPRHKVTLTRDFKMGKYEVTQGEWKAVMGDWTPSRNDRGIGDNYPVYDILLNDILGTEGEFVEVDNVKYYANGFIYKLRQKTGKPYRLPTEAEWEYAARGGKNGTHSFIYSGSNTLGTVAWNSGPDTEQSNAGWSTHEVGTLEPNELGIYDMSGNVSEWVADIWMNYSEEDQVDPISAVSGSNPGENYNDANGKETDARVHRGGSFGDLGGGDWRVSFRARINYSPGKTVYNGFRVALDVE